MGGLASQPTETPQTVTVGVGPDGEYVFRPGTDAPLYIRPATNGGPDDATDGDPDRDRDDVNDEDYLDDADSDRSDDAPAGNRDGSDSEEGAHGDGDTDGDDRDGGGGIIDYTTLLDEDDA